MKKKVILGLLLIVAVFGITMMPIKADSGWDSSYDSGGWDSGGSDWGGSSWDNDYDYSYSGGTYSGDGDGILGGIFGVIIGVVIIFLVLSNPTFNPRIAKKNSKNNSVSLTSNYRDINIDKIHSVDLNINIEEFKIYAYNVYKVIQTAWMNFDTETIRKFTTDEIYNMYSSQLETLKLKNQKNVMKNFEYIDAKIIDIRNENGVITINVYLRVKCLDYVINEKTKKTLRGSDSRRLDIEYVLSFVKSETDNKDVEKCPNCGAPVEMTSSATCPYCDSVLVKNANKYVMSKKTCINQRWG